MSVGAGAAVGALAAAGRPALRPERESTVELRNVSFDRLSGGRLVASGTARELLFQRKEGRFQAVAATALFRAGPGGSSGSLGDLQLLSPRVEGRLQPREARALESVLVRAERGDELTTESLSWDGTAGRVATAAPLELAGPGYRFRASGLQAKSDGSDVLLAEASGQIEARLGRGVPGPGAPPQPPAKAAEAQAPVHFHADTMHLEPRRRRTELAGNVELTRGDLRVTGDRAVVEFGPLGAQGTAPAGPDTGGARKPKPSLPVLGAEVERFTVDGRVHVVRTGRTADCDHAEYDAGSQLLALRGPASFPEGGGAPNPVLREGQERLSGDRILLHVADDGVEVAQPQMVLRRSQSGEKGPPQPVQIEARLLTIDQDRRLLHFREQVRIRRGAMTVTGPEMDGQYAADGAIEQLVIRGGATLVEGDRRATGQTCTYAASTRLVTLSGSPRLVGRGDELQGEQIVLSLDDDEVRVSQARGRLLPDAHRGEETAKATKDARAAVPEPRRPSP
jgi:lipopolysaccharide export system protein LptA